MGISHEFSQPGESLQRAKRDWSDDFTDQHGRRFSAQYDIGNSRPIGELAPVGFTPPWLPSMFYIRWAKAKGGFHFRWDYEALANELVGNAVSYYEQVMEFMLEHMKGEPIPELGDPVPSMVLRSPIGKPPLSPAIVLACQAGDPWGLGWSLFDHVRGLSSILWMRSSKSSTSISANECIVMGRLSGS